MDQAITLDSANPAPIVPEFRYAVAAPGGLWVTQGHTRLCRIVAAPGYGATVYHPDGTHVVSIASFDVAAVARQYRDVHLPARRERLAAANKALAAALATGADDATVAAAEARAGRLDAGVA